MLQGFKEFIMRGNVVELAVAVVVGTAFASVVDTVVSALVEPILNAAGAAEVAGLGFEIRSGMESTYVDLAAIINAFIVFLLTAAVVYLVLILPMNKINERRRRGVLEEEEVSEELAALLQIRDLLAQDRADGTP